MSRVGQIILMLSVLLLVLGGTHVYMWVRLVRDSALPRPWLQVATVSFIVLGLCVPSVFFLSRTLPHRITSVGLFVPYLWLGMMLFVVTFLLLTDLLRSLVSVGLLVGGKGQLLSHPGAKLMWARGAALVVLGVTVVLTGLSVRNGLAPPVVKRLEVRLPNLAPALDGFTIVQLADLHLGPTLGARWLQQVVDRTNALEPDLVAITGDLVDGRVSSRRGMIAPLADLRAPHGVFFVTGNHEFYSQADEWLPEIRKRGVQVLENQRVAITKNGAIFDLAGVHDVEGFRHDRRFRADLAKALAGRDPSRGLVLLAHQPKVVDAAAKAGVGLQLSGHTHGGQFWPWYYFVHLQQPYVSGLHDHHGTTLYVTQGTGFWGPAMRLGTRSEIVLVTLRSPLEHPQP